MEASQWAALMLYPALSVPQGQRHATSMCRAFISACPSSPSGGTTTTTMWRLCVLQPPLWRTL